MPSRPGSARSSRTRSKGRSPMRASPSSPLPAVSTSNASISRSVWRDSRISASSSMMRTDPDGVGWPLATPRGMTTASDMNCLSAQGKVESEGGAGAGLALDTDLARVFLDDSVGDRQAKACPAALAFFGRCFGREERVVDAVDEFRRDPGTGVGNANTDHVAVTGSYS